MEIGDKFLEDVDDVGELSKIDQMDRRKSVRNEGGLPLARW